MDGVLRVNVVNVVTIALIAVGSMVVYNWAMKSMNRQPAA